MSLKISRCSICSNSHGLKSDASVKTRLSKYSEFVSIDMNDLNHAMKNINVCNVCLVRASNLFNGTTSALFWLVSSMDSIFEISQAMGEVHLDSVRPEYCIGGRNYSVWEKSDKTIFDSLCTFLKLSRKQYFKNALKLENIINENIFELMAAVYNMEVFEITWKEKGFICASKLAVITQTSSLNVTKILGSPKGNDNYLFINRNESISKIIKSGVVK